MGMGISNDKRKRALLLQNSGPGVDEIFDTFQDVSEDKDYEKAVRETHRSLLSASQRNVRSV